MARHVTLLQCYNTINVIIDPKCCRLLMPAIIGISLGIAMSMMYAPFSENSCETFVANHDPQELVNKREQKSIQGVEDSMKFEPKLRLQQENVAPQRSPTKKLIRPRYASTELGIRERLFVAVMTSKTTIDTLGVAFNKTVQHHVTKMVFFMEEKGQTLPAGMSVVSFSDKYPHLVPIHVLKYISEHYPETFDYYMFVSDRAYLRGEKLIDLVNHISVSQHVYMGFPQIMKDGSGTYCPLEGGIILSQSILSRVLAELDWCSTNCHSSDPSLNLGQCLLHSTDMNCQEHTGTKSYTYFKVSDFDFDDEIPKLKQKEVFNASISVFPMPDDINHYKLHRYFCQHELNQTKKEIEKTRDNIIYMSQFAPGGRESVNWPIGVPEPYKPKSRFDVIRWDYFTETHIYFQDDFTNYKELKGVDKQDVQEVIKISVERLNEKYGNMFLYSSLVNGYRRFDPQRGMEYTLDLVLRDISKQNWEVEKRVHLVRPLGRVEIVPMPYVTENTRVNLILPVTVDEKDGVANFLDSYAKTCLDSGDNTYLLIVFIYRHQLDGGIEDTFSVLKSLVAYYERKYQNGGKVSWVSLTHQEAYISDLYIIDEVVSRFQPESLILLSSVGMELAPDYFNRVRMNTIQGWQVFFPIGFWQYKPNLIYDQKPYPTNIDINSKSGHYDANSYEHSSFYVSDFTDMRKLLSAEEAQDADIYDLFIKSQKLHVFRAIEPALKHKFKNFSCPSSAPLKMFQRCLTRRSLGLASRSQLAKIVFEHQKKFGPDQLKSTN
ncbi:chondroitin sulfate synthase 2 [Patella vulgata]|uniref:chondroitin sulfate synthase 2 n=1 Tax=Patella vulgata TaxID=6465 RepID=UPI0021802AFF|nr:chondroitin sulfate synthase 2 [Patella vulgata]